MAPPTKLVTETLSLDAYKKDAALQTRIKEITHRRECFPNANVDFADYPQGEVVLLRDLSLTADPKDPANIVGYNFLFTGTFIHPETGEICTVIKTGPVAVMNPDYPQDHNASSASLGSTGSGRGKYAGNNFAAKSTLAFVASIFLKNQLLGRLSRFLKVRSHRVFVLGALVNPRMRANIEAVGLHASSPAEALKITRLMQAMVPAVYPAHVNPKEFVYDSAFFSSWNADGTIPVATPHAVEISWETLRKALSLARKKTRTESYDFSENPQEVLKKYIRGLFSMSYPVLGLLSNKAVEYLKGDPKIEISLADIASERLLLIKILSEVIERAVSLSLTPDRIEALKNFVHYLKTPSAKPDARPALVKRARPIPAASASPPSTPPRKTVAREPRSPLSSCIRFLGGARRRGSAQRKAGVLGVAPSPRV